MTSPQQPLPSATPTWEAPPAPRARRRRLGRGALALSALLAAGATGGAVTQALQPAPAPAPAPAVIRSDTTVTGVSASVTGTPESAAATVGPSVVTISVTGTSTGAYGTSSPVSDTGSGVILRGDGYILTNNHVVAAAAGGGSVQVTFSDGTRAPARIVGTDATSDLAVIRVSGVPGLRAAVFADSGALHVGQTVLAVGAPLGLSNTVTEGIVSTLHRPVATGEPGASAQSVLDAVQTDAAINPGNSGGALVDLGGRVVGINSAIATTGGSTGGSTSGNIGVGFAIPSDAAAKVADQLIATGHAVHAQIGAAVADAGGATGTPGAGALLQAVTPGGPAAAAGLQAGDVVTRIDTRLVPDADTLVVATRAHDPGSRVTVTYLRGGATRTAQVTLAASA